MTTNEELIAEATNRINEWTADNQRPSDVGIIVRLRDRLAALTTPQEGDARERLRKVVARGAFEDFSDYPLDGENALVERVTDAILAAFPVLSRSADYIE